MDIKALIPTYSKTAVRTYNNKFTVFTPVYNCEQSIGKVHESLVNQTYKDFEWLIINDGSTDGSQTSIETICSRNTGFSYLLFDENYGLSAALKAGFDYTDTELVGYIDADLQTSPNDFNLLLAHINDYDLVTGVRTNRNDLSLIHI